MKEQRFIHELSLDIKASDSFQIRPFENISAETGIPFDRVVKFGSGEIMLKENEMLNLYYACGLSQNGIYRAMMRVQAMVSNCEDTPRRGKVTAFLSVKGGSGTTTQAVLLANELSANYKVIYLDASSPESAVRNRNAYFKDDIAIEVPYEIQRLRLPDVVYQTERIRDYYDYVILDLPRFDSHQREFEKILLSSTTVFIPFFNKIPQGKHDWEGFIQNSEGSMNDFLSFFETFHHVERDRPDVFLMPIGDGLSDSVKETLIYKHINIFPFVCGEHAEIGLSTMHGLSEDKELIHAPYQVDLRKVLYLFKYYTGALRRESVGF